MLLPGLFVGNASPFEKLYSAGKSIDRILFGGIETDFLIVTWILKIISIVCFQRAKQPNGTLFS